MFWLGVLASYIFKWCEHNNSKYAGGVIKMKISRSAKKMRRGDAFVDEPTGSAPLINLDGKTEHRSTEEVNKITKE